MCSKPNPDSLAISAQGLTKSYRIWRDPSDRIFSALWSYLAKVSPRAIRSGFLKKSANGYRDFFALSDINFEVKRGEAVGIIGRNGAGKSTLLQIIAGTLQTTSGNISIKGRVAALLELGAGFNPEFTGRENIFLTGAIIGLTKEEMQTRFAEIASFADIGEFIEQPIKTYSSGMMVRLAFAVQTAIEPDILIIDEALSVGDIFFQQKCANRMRDLQSKGTTLLFVSHDLASVRDLCERTLYLRGGKAAFWGETQLAIAQYYAEGKSNTTSVSAINAEVPSLLTSSAAGFREFQKQAIWTNKQIENEVAKQGILLGVAVLNDENQSTETFRMGAKARFKVLFQSQATGLYHVVVELKNHRGELVTSCGSYTSGLKPISLASGKSAYFELELDLQFEAGRYTFQILLAASDEKPNRGQRVDETPWLGPLETNWDYDESTAPFLGMFGPPVKACFLKHDELVD